MAPGLTPFRLWTGGVGIACLVIAAAYLPPRGGSPERAPRFANPAHPQGAKRVRAGMLAAEWRTADRAARLAEYREQLRPQIDDLRCRDAAGPALLFVGPLPDAARVTIAAKLDTAWRALQLGAPKVAVGVVVRMPEADVASRDRVPPRQNSNSPAFLLPDSSDRSTCVVLLPLDYWGRRPEQIAANPQLDAWLRSGLGPCAYFAALGAPAASVGRWLRARKFDLVLGVGWDRPNSARTSGWFGPAERHSPWFWRLLYGLPTDAVGCLGGREDGCRRAILAGADGTAPAGGEFDAFQWWRRQSLIGGEWYVSDLMRSFGRDRVARFWGSDLTVDSAFVEAMGVDIGAWTRRWQREQVEPVILGPRPPAGASVLSILLAAVAVGASARLAVRRRVA